MGEAQKDKGIVDKAKGTALKAYIFPPLGEGIAQVEAVIDELLRRGYAGWFVLEQDTCRGDPKDVARVNREYLEDLLARAGAHVARSAAGA